MYPFKALIVPLDDGQPPQIWGPGGPWPAPPIANVPGAPGYQPPGGGGGIWGGGNVPMPSPPIANVPGAPGYPPPSIWPSPGYPAHPIAPGGPPPHPAHPIPPNIWPDPTPPPGVIIPPPHVEHPIPPNIWPDPPGPPPGGATGSPEHPILEPPADPAGSSGYWALAYFPNLNDGKGGWIWVWVPTGKKADKKK